MKHILIAILISATPIAAFADCTYIRINGQNCRVCCVGNYCTSQCY